MDVPALKLGVVKEVKVKVGDKVSKGSLVPYWNYWQCKSDRTSKETSSLKPDATPTKASRSKPLQLKSSPRPSPSISGDLGKGGKAHARHQCVRLVRECWGRFSPKWRTRS